MKGKIQQESADVTMDANDILAILGASRHGLNMRWTICGVQRCPHGGVRGDGRVGEILGHRRNGWMDKVLHQQDGWMGKEQHQG